MKNLWMTKTAMAFDPSSASGGGAAVAEAAGATGAAGGGSSGAGASAGAGGGAAAAGGGAPSDGAAFSFFRGLGTRDLTPKPDAVKTVDAAGNAAVEPAAGAQTFEVTDDAGKVLGSFKTKAEADAFVAADGQAADGAAAAGDFNVVAEDGVTLLGTFKTQAEADAFAQAESEKLAAAADGGAAAGAAAITADTKLPIKIFGRFETIKQVEEYLAQSGTHAKKLDADLKALKTSAKAEIDRGLVTRDAEIAGLKAELESARKTPPFAVLDDAGEEALAKESPVKFGKYLLAKDKHEQGLQKIKDDAAKAVHDRQKRNEALGAEITRLEAEMASDPVKWPAYETVEPLMVKMHEMTGGEQSPLIGRPWAKVLYFFAAHGANHIALINKGKTVKAAATVHAKRTAAAGAAAAGGPGAGSAAAGRPVKVDPNRDWNKKIDEVGGRKVLNFSESAT